MDTLFIKLLNLSISAGMLVLVVLAIRLFLKKTSRRAVCFLWIAVALRLAVPVYFESSFSIIPSGDYFKINDTQKAISLFLSVDDRTNAEVKSSKGTENSDFAITPDYSEQNTANKVNSGENLLYENTQPKAESTPYENARPEVEVIPVEAPSETGHIWAILAYVWLIGIAFIFTYTVIAFLRVKKIVSESIKYKDTLMENVYICDRIDNAFILGVVRPKIFLSGNLNRQQIDNILAHENIHLERKDHIWKLLGFVLLTIYWFNPLIWIAYLCFCRDIEFACDESVILGMDPDQIRDYSDTLLICSTGRHMTYGSPLAFGEQAVKDRIKAALSYKKPLFWVIVTAFILLIAAGTIFFTKPSANTGNDEGVDISDKSDVTPTPVVTADNTDKQDPNADKTVREAALDENSNITSVPGLFDAITYGNQYGLINDFNFSYVMPGGEVITSDFGYVRGTYFRDYANTWPEISKIEMGNDPFVMGSGGKSSENGHFLVSTAEEYNENHPGYRIYFADKYVHVFSSDDVGEQYLWSYCFMNDFQPNLYSIRRIMFDKHMYDSYVQYCSYENEITAPGLYYLNRGYLADLDGDGNKEKLFIASCGWINYPEPDNIEGWTALNTHISISYDSYYENSADSLIYINGRLCNGDDHSVIHDNNIPYMFAITDIDKSDSRYELLIDSDPDDVFYIYQNGTLSKPIYCGGYFIRNEWLPGNSLSKSGLNITVFGDGTFSGEGKVKLEEYNTIFYAKNLTWRMDKNGNTELIGDIFDVYWNSEFLKLEYVLDVSEYPNFSSYRARMEPGDVYIDKTDAISKIHLVSPDTGVSGWIDLANLARYVRDYETSGLEELDSIDFMDVLFSNVNHPE
ncbi:MAG: M56 family metallopeptidase [Lachnospiraceae bacterium]|nr:M56 family metallopeptidase [Lachnospiraceae bacterium]